MGFNSIVFSGDGCEGLVDKKCWINLVGKGELIGGCCIVVVCGDGRLRDGYRFANGFLDCSMFRWLKVGRWWLLGFLVVSEKKKRRKLLCVSNSDRCLWGLVIVGILRRLKHRWGSVCNGWDIQMAASSSRVIVCYG